MSGKSKYKVGDEFNNSKRIVEYCGSHSKNRVSMWKWQCINCGTIHGPSPTATLTRKDRVDSLPRCCMVRGFTKGYKDLSGTKFGQIKQGRFRGKGINKRELEFTITPQYLWELFQQQNGKCIYTGRTLDINGDASVDRINSSRGYIPGNVEWVHKHVNRAKMDLSRSEFLVMCQDINKNFVQAHVPFEKAWDDPAGPDLQRIDMDITSYDPETGIIELFIPRERMKAAGIDEFVIPAFVPVIERRV